MPTIQELENFKLSDAVKFHNELNPSLWDNETLQPEVRDQLLKIAQDFISYLGVKDLDVLDITISGSNAAYSYTPHSDLDLHILVDMDKLPNDEIYRELFTAKKTLYNDSHSITVHDVPVELYVQDSNQPHISLGAYSVLTDKWIHIPKKRRANFDEASTKAKFESLKDLVELAINTKDLSRVEKAIDIIKRYRQAGLNKAGEFGPENLAYKAIRKQGGIKELYDLKNTLRSEKLSIEEATSRHDAILKIKKLQNTQGRTPAEIQNINNIIANLAKQHSINLSDITPGDKKIDPLQAKIAKAAYEKAQAGNMFHKEWERFKQGIFAENGVDEDYDPNGPPPGPEFKPTMPKGTVRVDVSDVYDWYKLGQHISNLKGLGKHDFGQGPPSTILSFGDEETEHKYIQDLMKTGLTTTDIDPIDPNQPKGMKRQKTDPTYNVNEAEPAKPTTSINFRTWQRGGVPKHSFVVVRNGEEIAYGELAKDNEWDHDRGASVQEIVVHPNYRRKGVATKIYNEIERRFNYKLHPSDDVKPDGQAFWKARGNLDKATDPTYNVNETDDRTAAVLKIQKHLNKKYGANLDLDGKLGPLTLKSINKFMPRAKTGLADEPNKTTAVQGKKVKVDEEVIDLRVYRNPSPKQLYNLTKRSANRHMRGMYHDGDTFWWDANEAIHKQGSDYLGIPYDYLSRMESAIDSISDNYRIGGDDNVPQNLIQKYDIENEVVYEASGYIPSEKEKNDPRFKTALTVDVKPDAIKKNATAFNWKTSRAGIPPQARPDGKI